MPEGVEVRRLVFQLKKLIEGSQIRAVKGDIPEIQKLKLPVTVTTVGCRGKFIYMLGADRDGAGIGIANSLGVRGRWTIPMCNSQRAPRHVEIVYEPRLQTCAASKLWLSDASLNFVEPYDIVKKISTLGPDVFSKTFTEDLFMDIMEKHKGWGVADILINQQIISGLGVYLVSDILFTAGVWPGQVTLTPAVLAKIYGAIIEITRLSARNQTWTLDSPVCYTSGYIYGKKQIYDAAAGKMIDTAKYKLTGCDVFITWVPGMQN